MNKKTAVLVAVSTLLTACIGGGGGGGGGGTSATLAPFVNRDVPFHTPTRIDSVQVKVGASSYTYDSSALISQDLNNDGSQSLILAGRMDPNHNTHHNFALQLWDWENGQLVNQTSQWFSGNDNHIVGTEPSVEFGDFDNDGRMDMYVAPYTDTNIHGPGVVFFNEGTQFTRRNIDLDNTHGHGSVLYDLDGDGYLDIVTTGLRFTFGSAGRNFTTHWGRGDYPGGGGDLAVADFIGDGTSSLILTDMDSNQHTNNRLYSWSMQQDGVYIHQVSALPTPRFLLPKWHSYGFSGSHDMRILAFDFDNSGLTDAVIFSRPWVTNGQWPAHSEIQFNRNHGNGVFEDVTDSVLVGYDTSMPVTYHPVLMDVNNDGLIDIVLSNTSWDGNHGAQVLLHTTDHKYVASYARVLEAFVQQSFELQQALNNTASWGDPGVAFVRGPDDQMYLATGISYQANGVQQKAIYLSRLGNLAATAPATADVISQVWPWMTSADVNRALAGSSIQYINGIPVIDFDNALRPVGSLGISTTGRTGDRQSIQGHISIPGLDSAVLSHVTAVDALSRDFVIDMSSLTQTMQQLPIEFDQVSSAQHSWSSKFVGGHLAQHSHWHLSSRDANYSAGVTVPLSVLDPSLLVTVSNTKIKGSPWLSFSGVFGSVNSSSMLELSINKTWKNGAWTHLGVIQTATGITPGLVTQIEDLWSAHAVIGWNHSGWNLYAGIPPTVFDGSATVRLPESVNSHGQLHYKDHKIKVRNQTVAFAGIGYSVQHQNQKISLNTMFNGLGQHAAKINYSLRF